MNKGLNVLQQKIGYQFKDQSLLKTALTHSSYAHEHNCASNERLEFLGDSILNFLVSERLYGEGKSEGDMTRLRARIVSRGPLAVAVEKLGAMNELLLGAGAEKEEKVSVKFVSNIFEAITGAIYIDSGSLKACSDFIFSHLDTDSEGFKDYKSELQELVQAEKMGKIEYKVIAREDRTTPQFFAEVFIGVDKVGEGYGGKKKDAEKGAAKAALIFLKERHKK